MIDKFVSKKRIKWMAIEAVIVLLLFLALKLNWAALGLAVGALVSIFNFCLVTGKTFITQRKDETLRNPLGGYLIRLMVDGTILVVASLINPGMLLGALFGLTLEMQTYFLDAITLVFKEND